MRDQARTSGSLGSPGQILQSRFPNQAAGRSKAGRPVECPQLQNFEGARFPWVRLLCPPVLLGGCFSRGALV